MQQEFAGQMTDRSRDRKCPSCGGSDVEPKGVTAAFYPRRDALEADRGRGTKVVERKFQCRHCGHEFSEIEESDI